MPPLLMAKSAKAWRRARRSGPSRGAATPIRIHARRWSGERWPASVQAKLTSTSSESRVSGMSLLHGVRFEASITDLPSRVAARWGFRTGARGTHTSPEQPAAWMSGCFSQRRIALGEDAALPVNGLRLSRRWGNRPRLGAVARSKGLWWSTEVAKDEWMRYWCR